MSNTLNEKFEEFAAKQSDVLKEYQDLMPTVTATVIPATGSDPTAVSGDPQQRSSGKEEPSGSEGIESKDHPPETDTRTRLGPPPPLQPPVPTTMESRRSPSPPP